MTPQLEDGYTRIADELLEALAYININGEARRVLDVIIRKTYGFNKKRDRISLSQFCLATGLQKPNVVRAIRKLVDINIVIRTDNALGVIYAINKKYSTWQSLSKPITLSKPIISVISPDKASLSEPIPTIDNATKDTNTKDIKRFKKPSLEEVQAYITEKGYEVDPQAFIDKCESNGWTVGKYQAPMKNWKSTINTWERNNKKDGKWYETY